MKEDAERGLDDTRTTATTSPKGDHTADPAVSSAASEALKEAQAEELDITFGHTSGMSLPSPLRATSRKAGESRKEQQLGDIQDELEAIESGPSTSADTQAQGNEIKADDDHDGDPVQNIAADEMDVTFGRSSLLPKVPALLPGAAAEDFAEAEKPAEQPVEKLEEFAGPAAEVLAMQPAGKAKPPKPAAQLEVQAATPSAEQSLQPLEEKTQAVRHLAEKRPAKHLPAGNEPAEQPKDRLAGQPEERPGEQPEQRPIERAKARPAKNRFEPRVLPEELKAAEHVAEQPEELPAERPTEQAEQPEKWPAGKLNDQPAQQPPEQPEDWLAEQPQEQQKERPTEQPEEQTAEQPNNQPTEQPEERQAEEQPAEQPDDQPTEQPEERPEEPAQQLPDDRLPEQPEEERPAEQPEERLTEQPEEPAEQLEELLAEQSEEPAEQLEERPTEQREARTAEQPEERPTEQPKEQPEERSAENAAAQPAEPAVGQLAGLGTWKAPCDSEGVSEQASSLTNVEDSELFQEPEELV
ncbi:unnamed protein product [Effrenium voratum]|nr:unnamed protein product [Effrenium voratum]